MVATPAQRNRLMQKLRAETWIRRKNGIYENERNGRNELRGNKEECSTGDSVPSPLGFIASMPIPVK